MVGFARNDIFATKAFQEEQIARGIDIGPAVSSTRAGTVMKVSQV